MFGFDFSIFTRQPETDVLVYELEAENQLSPYLMTITPSVFT